MRRSLINIVGSEWVTLGSDLCDAPDVKTDIGLWQVFFLVALRYVFLTSHATLIPSMEAHICQCDKKKQPKNPVSYYNEKK